MTTSIEWARNPDGSQGETWNPVTGCTKVSPGCDHCYAERITNRFGGAGAFDKVVLHPERLDKPLHWRKPRRVFVNSMADLFHDDVPDEFIVRVFAVMGAAERHTFQVLTKRPGRMRSLLSDPEFIRDAQRRWWAKWFMALDTPDELPTRRAEDPSTRPLRIDNRRWRALMWSPDRQTMPLASSDLPWPLSNVWLGVSVEDQHWADIRIPKLLETPAAVRFLSCEPLLGPIDLSQYLYPNDEGIEVDPDFRRWVIAGGESGPDARPLQPDWVRSLRDQCVAAGVPYFFKQRGEWTWDGDYRSFTHLLQENGHLITRASGTSQDPYGHGSGPQDLVDRGHAGWVRIRRVGKKAAGRELDGRTWDQFPRGSE